MRRSLVLLGFPPALVLVVVAAVLWAPATVAVVVFVAALLVGAALTAAWTWHGAIEEAERRRTPGSRRPTSRTT